MRSTTRNLCTLTAAAGLTLGSFAAFAQDGATGNTMDPTKMPPVKAAGDAAQGAAGAVGSAASGMEADQAIVEQLRKIAQTPDKAGDQLFVLEAAAGNMWEVESSRAVMAKSQDQQVKQLAQMMIQEHSQNNEKLMPIAQQMGLTLPKSLPSEKQAKLAVMAAMPVDKMEQAYLCDMKKDHAKTVTAFVDHAALAQDEKLKSYITESIPKLQQHTQHVVQAATAKGIPGSLTMGGSQSSSGSMTGGSTSGGSTGGSMGGSTGGSTGCSTGGGSTGGSTGGTGGSTGGGSTGGTGGSTGGTGR